jgi:hypothetical protein
MKGTRAMKKLIQYFVLLMSLAGIFMLTRSLSNAGEAETTMRIEPTFSEYVQGEALKFLITLTNHGTKPVRVKLGADGIENLSIILTRDGKSEPAAAPVRSGLTKLVTLEVPANGTKTHSLYLDEFVRLNHPGTYELSIEIVGTHVPPASTTFRILPNTEAYHRLIESRYSELRRKMLSPDASPESRADMRKAIVLSRHALALDMQEEMLHQRDWRDEKEYEHLVDALVSSQSQHAIRSLVENILANAESSAFEKAVVLNRLRLAEVEKWRGPAYELLVPYLGDIEASTPMVISD